MASPNLGGDETLVAQLRTHKKILVPPSTLALLLIAAAVAAPIYLPRWVDYEWAVPAALGLLAALALVWVVVPILRWRFATYTITTARVTVRRGILYRHHRDIPVHRITQVSCERGIIDRVFGCGTLILFDAASAPAAAGGGTRFHDVPRVAQVEDALNDLIYSSHSDPQPESDH